MCWNKVRLCWKIAKLFYSCHLKKLVRPETFGPYYVRKMLWGIYSAICGEVNVSVEKCFEIKGDYVVKYQICSISVTLKSWSGRKLLDPTTYFGRTWILVRPLNDSYISIPPVLLSNSSANVAERETMAVHIVAYIATQQLFPAKAKALKQDFLFLRIW